MDKFERELPSEKRKKYRDEQKAYNCNMAKKMGYASLTIAVAATVFKTLSGQVFFPTVIQITGLFFALISFLLFLCASFSR